MSFNYVDKVFVITGGAGGIGSALATQAAKRGARIVIVDIRLDAAQRLSDQLSGGPHLPLGVDLTNRSAVAEMLSEVDKQFGRIDVLVNNVGMTSADRFDERTVESIVQELDVNLYSPLLLTRLALDLLYKSADPRVVSTVSLGGIFPLGETPIYTASKFGLRGAMLSIGLDLRAKGILAGSVLPSATDTRMLRQEALDGGNSLQFQDPPQSPHTVAKAMMRLLDKPKLEVYPRRSEAWLVKLAMLIPNQLPAAMKLFRRKGERGLVRYLKQLRAEGKIVDVEGRPTLVD